MADSVLTFRVAGREFDNFEAAADALLDGIERQVKSATQKVGLDILDTLQRVAARLREEHGSPYSGPDPSSTVLKVRSGAGLRSILNSVKLKGATLETIEGSISTAGLTVHETGATITPRRSKYLTVPLPAALTSQGLPKRARARDWDNTFVQRSRRGNLIIFQRRGASIVPLYILKDRVRLPPRLGMEKHFNDALPHFMMTIVDRYVKELKP